MKNKIYLLHLETSTKVCSVSLSLNGLEVQLKESTEDQFVHGEKLTLFIEEVLKIEQIAPKDLSGVSIASGPGSYTGLRIGTSTAKGLCYALKIPLIAIDTLLSLAAQAQSKYSDKNLCPLIDARRMEVYNAIYSCELENLKPISADVIEADSYAAFKNLVVFGDGAEKLKEIWSERQILFDDEIFCSAAGQVKLAFKKFKNKEFEDTAYFEPFYLKDFVALKPKAKTNL
jgi:tRNA threonylcarbamoyladenosine biosynthesis protein TsaB